MKIIIQKESFICFLIADQLINFKVRVSQKILKKKLKTSSFIRKSNLILENHTAKANRQLLDLSSV